VLKRAFVAEVEQNGPETARCSGEAIENAGRLPPDGRVFLLPRKKDVSGLLLGTSQSNPVSKRGN
jgi:hypothetical protein